MLIFLFRVGSSEPTVQLWGVYGEAASRSPG